MGLAEVELILAEVKLIVHSVVRGRGGSPILLFIFIFLFNLLVSSHLCHLPVLIMEDLPKLVIYCIEGIS